MHRFFAAAPETVAQRLVGKALAVNGKDGVILAALPQTAADNSRWLESRPLFGPNPVDAYIAAYRGNQLLFLRTGHTNTCVRIDRLSIGGEVFNRPGQVCKALDLDHEQTGKVEFNGRVVSVILS